MVTAHSILTLVVMARVLFAPAQATPTPRKPIPMAGVTQVGLDRALPPDYQADYQEMVQLYASGQHQEALAALGNWNEERLKAHLKALKEAVVTIRSCPRCPAREQFARFPLRAAILLHGHREIQQQLHPPVSEQPSRCGIGPQSQFLDHLTAILILIDPKAGDFLRPFYLGMAKQALWSHCQVESQFWAEAGTKKYLGDASLRLALGVALETRAFFTLPPAPATLIMGTAIYGQYANAVRNIQNLRELARQEFQQTLDIDPNQLEAGLRLGRVWWWLGKGEEARAALEAVLKKSDVADVTYLAHLFLGRVLEDKGQLADAERHYRAALSLQPLCETPAVALSHVRFLQGDLDSAQEALSNGLREARRRTTFDPLVPYLVPQTNGGDVIFAGLRRSLVP